MAQLPTGERVVSRIEVRAVCDAVLFVRSSDLHPFVHALRAMSRSPDYLTHNSLHFVTWHTRALVTTLYAMPAHDANPQREWNPLYSLPSRAESDYLGGPWVRATEWADYDENGQAQDQD